MLSVIILTVFLASGVWADTDPHPGQLKLENNFDGKFASVPNIDPSTLQPGGKNITEKFDSVDSGCDFPFEKVGNRCIFFSTTQLPFDEAQAYCESISHGHNNEVFLAMLDNGKEDDQLLLEAVAARNGLFWLGAKSEDGTHWYWLNNKEINLQSSYWAYTDPNIQGKSCAAAEVTTNSYNSFVRAYLYNYECTQSLNFICETGCPIDFRKVGGFCYFISEEVGLPHASFHDARSYCQSLAVHDGYYVDLAVFGLPGEDDVYLMNTLTAAYGYVSTWIGAYDNGDCDYLWVDGRQLKGTSTLWYHNEPDCGSPAHLYQYTTSNRSYLVDNSETSLLPFICQLYVNA